MYVSLYICTSSQCPNTFSPLELNSWNYKREGRREPRKGCLYIRIYTYIDILTHIIPASTPNKNLATRRRNDKHQQKQGSPEQLNLRHLSWFTSSGSRVFSQASSTTRRRTWCSLTPRWVTSHLAWLREKRLPLLSPTTKSTCARFPPARCSWARTPTSVTLPISW